MKAMITYDIIVLIVNFLHPSTQRRDILRIRTSMSTYCDIQLRTPINVKRHIREIHAREVTYLVGVQMGFTIKIFCVLVTNVHVRVTNIE